MTLSLRARFALASGALVLVVAAAVAVAGYLALRRTLDQQARQAAAGQASQVAALVDAGGADRARAEGNYVDVRDPTLTRQLARPGLWIVVLGAKGQTLQRSPAAPASLAPADLLRTCRTRGLTSSTHSRPAAAVSCRRLGTAARPVGFVVTAVPLASAYRTLTTTRRALTVGVLAGGAGSFLLAWVLAARALRPLRRIADTARSIRMGDLGRRIGYAGRDELGELAAELDASFAELDRALERQERFAADASHELKTPLAAAHANVELLRRWADADPATRADALAALERSTARMSRVVSDLLQLAQGDDRLRYTRAPVRLDDLVLEAEREARAVAGGVEVRLEHIDQAVVIGDRDRLAQLVANLVDNALRFTPAGGVVGLSLRQLEGRAVLSVSDTGPGIPEADLPRVFDRFYRGRSADRGGGSGLGLAIARVIARAHGGDVEAANRPGGGAVFTVRLPASDVSSDRHRGFIDASSRSGTVAGNREQGGDGR